MKVIALLNLFLLETIFCNRLGNTTLVKSVNATYMGIYSTSGKVKSFKGIRFAEPPIGKRRFKKPVLLRPAVGFVNATVFGPRCIQGTGLTTMLSHTPQSEDCLNLNVYTPANPNNLPLPVFVYVFGGGFSCQSNSDPIYDGVRFIERNQDIILVTINYRQGFLGFLAHQKVIQQGYDLNVGLWDVVAAFQWVKSNIAVFGGDPNRITAGGQSAGAMSIASLMLAENGKQKLFDRAILLGGNFFLRQFELSDRIQQFQDTLEVAACPDDENAMECLVNADAQNITTATNLLQWSLTVDNEVVIRQQIQALEQGRFSKIPTIFSNDRDEGTAFAFLLQSFTRAKTQFLMETLTPIFNDKIDLLHQMYGMARRFPYKTFSSLVADYYFHCPTYLATRSFARYVDTLYLSRFDHILQSFNLFNLPAAFLGVFHASEVPSLWLSPFLFTPNDRTIKFMFHDSLMNFVKWERPLKSAWLTFNTKQQLRFEFQNQIMVRDDDRAEKCMFMINAAKEYHARMSVFLKNTTNI